jgi:hypothetical protein
MRIKSEGQCAVYPRGNALLFVVVIMLPVGRCRRLLAEEGGRCRRRGHTPGCRESEQPARRSRKAGIRNQNGLNLIFTISMEDVVDRA